MFAFTKKKTLALAVASLCMLASLWTAPPASSHGWTEPNSWAAGHTIGVGYLSSGNVVATWQLMTHAQLGGWCPRYGGCTYNTDGQFGTKTRNYTILWQTQYQQLVPSLVVDGIVGPQTWNAARFFNLRRTGGDANWDWYRYGPSGIYSPGFNMAYAKPYATWAVSPWYCDWTLIDHPSVSPNWNYGCW